MLLPLLFRFCSSFEYEYPEFFCFHMPFIPMSPTKKYKPSLQNRYIHIYVSPHDFLFFRWFGMKFPTVGNLSVGIDVKNLRQTCEQQRVWISCDDISALGKTWWA